MPTALFYKRQKKELISKYFNDDNQTIAQILYGQTNQQFEVTSEKPETGSYLSVVPQEFVESSSQIIDLPEKPKTEILDNISTNLSNYINFPRPDFATFSRNLSNTFQGIANQFSSSSTTQASLPNINASSAMKYLGIARELNFVSPEASLLLQDVEILNLPINGFSIAGTQVFPAGNVAVNFGLNGIGLGFTPVVSGVTEAVTTTVATTTTEAAVATAAEGAAVAAAPETAGLSLVVLAVLAVGKKIWNKFKDWFPEIYKFLNKAKDYLAGFGIGALLVGLLSGNLFLTGGGGFVLGASILSGASLSGIANAVGGLLVVSFGAFLKELTKPLIGFLLGFPILVALILFIINSGAYVVPPGKSLTNKAVGQGSSFSCTGSSTLGQFVTGCGGVSLNAETIANSLVPGFWGYYNKTCIYPNLFDEEEYAVHPNPCIGGSTNNPPQCSGTAEGINMFWCTWLVIKSTNEAGFDMPTSYNGGSMIYVPTMIDWFKNQNRFLNSDTPASQIPVGSAMFFLGDPGTGGGTGHHVGIIVKVTQDYVTMVQSNGAGPFETFKITNNKITNNSDQYPIAGYGSLPIQCTQ